jgi:PAS domain S-box-containing protein
MADSAQRPVELILARGVMSNLGASAFLVDVGGNVVFFNDAAAEVLGLRFEEAATISAAEWQRRITARDDDGRPVPVDELPLMIALHQERPAYRRLRVRSASGDEHRLDISAFPIVGSEGVRGAMAIFWDATS